MKITENSGLEWNYTFYFLSIFAIIKIYEENIVPSQSFYSWILMLCFGTSIRYEITGTPQI